MTGSDILFDAFWLFLGVAGVVILVSAMVDLWRAPERRRIGSAIQRLGRGLSRQKANTVTIIPPR